MSTLPITTRRDHRGEVVVSVFGLPRRVGDYGALASAVLQRALDRAAHDGSADIDLDELAAADRRDREEKPVG